ncbi:hypothetical protein [Burkholderia vietnamiensis]|uniref:hypothetical protein n=1 Tax=Burkholderia vietnamiensis TaxID=60552 RepID=UPI00158F10CF|nr:hypothetical protein [Burkholderia vietnamiensis]
MEYEKRDVQKEFDELVKRLDLKMTTQFVPFSISRNADSNQKSLNWKVTLSSIRNKMTFDYSKGVGHLPYPNELHLTKHQKSVVNQAVDSAVETGVARKIARGAMAFTLLHSKEEFPTPTLQEVLYSLTQDADVTNYLVYEHWADEFGYDPDSRKGEKIYEECRLQASKLSDVLGGMDKVQNLREILQELDCQPATPRMKPRF